MQALGLIETKGLVVAIESADAMLKAADVNLLEKTYVGGGLVSIVVTGDVAAVTAAVEAGGAAVRMISSILLVSQHVIPRPHEDLDNIIVSAVPMKKRDITTLASTKKKLQEEIAVKVIEEGTVEVSVEHEEKVVENLSVKDSQPKEFLLEKTVSSLKMDSSELNNKKVIDKIVFEHGIDEAIEVLSKLKVVELRNLARKYKDFGIKGRAISEADKKLLLTEFREYYGRN